MTKSARSATDWESFGPSLSAAVLDIGGDFGAAVVHTMAPLDGVEIEITPDGCEWDGTHVAVRQRTSPSPDAGPFFCAVFGQLRAGDYRIRVRDDRRHSGHLLRVEGAQVVHIKSLEASPDSRVGAEGLEPPTTAL
jgi:hypothetical protein